LGLFDDVHFSPLTVVMFITWLNGFHIIRFPNLS
jgi:hypothetical protein